MNPTREREREREREAALLFGLYIVCRFLEQKTKKKNMFKQQQEREGEREREREEEEKLEENFDLGAQGSFCFGFPPFFVVVD